MTISNEDFARDLASRLNLSGKPYSELDEMKIEAELAAAELRGRIEELKKAAGITNAEIVTAKECGAHAATLALGAVKRAISARLASLQPEVAQASFV